MPSFSNATFMLGPLYCAWQPHAHGRPAERAVRSWLAQPLDCEADAIPLQRSARGRPQLAAPFEHFDVSWSHSGEQLLIILGRQVQVGVDLERMRPRPRVLELAQRYFTAAETRWLSAHADGGREEAFIRLWCAKEAVLKAHGYGLAFGLDRLAFAETREGLVLVECDAGLGAAKDWSLIEFVPAKAYRAALAWRPAR
ncbi:MAG: 4'-phosphopantetheinyl transferase superfamily protein [Luteimonas sp.]